MAKTIILVALGIFLLLLAIIFLAYYKGYTQMQEENRELEKALEDQFILQAESFDTYLSMLREACREGNPWDDHSNKKR